MQISPLIYDEKGHRVASEDDVLDPKHIKVSADKANVLTNDDGLLVKAEDLVSAEEGNLLSVGADGKLKAAASDASTFVSAEKDNTLTTGADGKLYVPPVELNVDVLSKEEGNMIRYGEDQGVFLDGNDVLSNGEKNLLKISNIDGLIELTEETLKAAGFIPGENAVAGVKPNDPLLSLDSDGLLSTAFDVEYDEVTGLTKFKGADGRIAATVTLPVAVKTIKSVTLETDPIGMGKGQFIHFVFDTTGDEERDIYLDVTRLFNVYKAGQGIDISSDGTISTVISDIVALEPDNVIQEKDGKLYVSPISVYGELVSADEGNVIVKGTDQRVYLGKEQLDKAVNDSIKDGSVPLVSKDGDNVITEGSDKGAMLSKSDLAAAVQEQVMAGSVKVVSTDDQNLITEGTDKGAFLNQEGFAEAFTAAREGGSLKVVSEQADNVIVEGSDKGAFLDKAGLGTAIKEGALSGDIALASGDSDNLLQKGADGGVTLNEERLASAVGGIITAGEVTVVSTDENNVITEGVDHGAYLNKEGFKTAVKEAITSKASGVVSGNAGNVITEGTDGGANLSKQALAAAVTEQITGGAVKVVSTDAGNIVKEGKDKGAFLGASDLGTAVASGLTDGSIDLISGDAKNAAKLGTDKKVFVEDKYLPLSGGTMTGTLTLKANPTANLQAATKQYVDTENAKYLPLTAGDDHKVVGPLYIAQEKSGFHGSHALFIQGRLLEASIFTAPTKNWYCATYHVDKDENVLSGVVQQYHKNRQTGAWLRVYDADSAVQAVNLDLEEDDISTIGVQIDPTKVSHLGIAYPPSGEPYTVAPNPPQYDETTKIATTAWVGKKRTLLFARKYIYVNAATGNDKIEPGRGETRDMPFKTIQAALNYVAHYVDLGLNSVSVEVWSGTYNEILNTYGAIGNFEGEVVLEHDNTDTQGGRPLIRGTVDRGYLLCHHSPVNLRIFNIDFEMTRPAGCINGTGILCSANPSSNVVLLGSVEISNCKFTCIDEADVGSGVGSHMMFCCTTGSILFRPNIDIVYKHTGRASDCIVFAVMQHGGMWINPGDAENRFTISGEYSLIMGMSRFSRFRRATSARSVVITAGEDGCIGKRYELTTNSVCLSNGGGPEFFPGDVAGTADEKSFCYYQ